MRCKNTCNLLFAGKNIIDALWSGNEKIIEDDKQVISVKIVQRRYKENITRISVFNSNNSKLNMFPGNNPLISFNTAIEPCEILLPEFRENKDAFSFRKKNDAEINKHLSHLNKNYFEYMRVIGNSCISLTMDIYTKSKRKDLDNIALLLALALKKANILPEFKYIKELNLNLIRGKGITEKAVVKIDKLVLAPFLK